jgi:hypothetical protein
MRGSARESSRRSRSTAASSLTARRIRGHVRAHRLTSGSPEIRLLRVELSRFARSKRYVSARSRWRPAAASALEFPTVLGKSPPGYVKTAVRGRRMAYFNVWRGASFSTAGLSTVASGAGGRRRSRW